MTAPLGDPVTGPCRLWRPLHTPPHSCARHAGCLTVSPSPRTHSRALTPTLLHTHVLTRSQVLMVLHMLTRSLTLTAPAAYPLRHLPFLYLEYSFPKYPQGSPLTAAQTLLFQKACPDHPSHLFFFTCSNLLPSRYRYLTLHDVHFSVVCSLPPPPECELCEDRSLVCASVAQSLDCSGLQD